MGIGLRADLLSNVPARLEAGAAANYAALTFARYRHLLAKATSDGSVAAFGVAAPAGPLGLALAVRGPGDGEATLCSLGVAEDARGHGLGTALMLSIEKEMVRRGTVSIAVMYGADEPCARSFEAVLRKCGWQPPKHAATVHRSTGEDAKRFANAVWAPLPEGYTLTPWSAVSQEERAIIGESFARDPTADPGVSPFHSALEFDESSLVARHEDVVAGWMLTRRLKRGALLFDALYIKPEYQKGNVAAPLILETIRRGYRLYRRYGYSIIWNTRSDNRSMMAFNGKRLASFVTTRNRLFTSYREIAGLS